MKKKKVSEIPSVEQLEKELGRQNYKQKYRRTLKSTVCTLITAAAIAILVATLFLPVLQIYGNSMNPTLSEGNIVVSLKDAEFKQGDVIAFYYNNKILVKRVICGPGSWVKIDKDGTVYVDNKPIDEPYLKDKAFGDCDIELPYQVPESRYFVMGDHRSTSVDSRSTTVGCIAEEQIVGKIVFRVWPLNRFGAIE